MKKNLIKSSHLIIDKFCIYLWYVQELRLLINTNTEIDFCIKSKNDYYRLNRHAMMCLLLTFKYIKSSIIIYFFYESGNLSFL